MSDIASLYVSVPIASFRMPRAREYFETFPCPPPSTVYGMLLSMVGETDRRRHEGCHIAIALIGAPTISVVLRTMWRIKDQNEGPGLGANRRPDFQELLTDLSFVVWISRGEDGSSICLAERVSAALQDPGSVHRFGGLSLGESTHLVNDIRNFEPRGRGQVLIRSDMGELSLPVWPDHVGSFTRWEQYSLEDIEFTDDLPIEAWTAIRRPAMLAARSG